MIFLGDVRLGEVCFFGEVRFGGVGVSFLGDVFFVARARCVANTYVNIIIILNT